MDNYHKYSLMPILLGFFILSAYAQDEQINTWIERQNEEMNELRSLVKAEKKQTPLDDLQKADKEFMNSAMIEDNGYMEDSISSAMSGISRKPTPKKEKAEEDENLELLIPKSNPFEQKRRGR